MLIAVMKVVLRLQYYTDLHSKYPSSREPGKLWAHTFDASLRCVAINSCIGECRLLADTSACLADRRRCARYN